MLETLQSAANTLQTRSDCSKTKKSYLQSAQSYVASLLDSAISAAQSLVSSAVDSAKSALASAVSLTKSYKDMAADAYYSITSSTDDQTLTNKLSEMLGMGTLVAYYKKALSLITGTDETCPTATTTLSIFATSSDPTIPVTKVGNTTAEAIVLPATNDSSVNSASAEVKQLKTLTDSTCLDTGDVADVAADVEGTLSSKGVLEQREWVRRMLGMHPFVDQKLLTLASFQPISQYVSSWALAYTPDTPSLPLEYWDGYYKTSLTTNRTTYGVNSPRMTAPQAIRNNLKFKMNQSIYDMIEKSYSNINKKFVDSLPIEFSQDKLASSAMRTAHSYRLVGDYMFAYNFMDPISYYENLFTSPILDAYFLTTMYSKTVTKVANLIYHVNYLKPVVSTEVAKNNSYLVNVEGFKNILIDARSSRPMASPSKNVAGLMKAETISERTVLT